MILEIKITGSGTAKEIADSLVAVVKLLKKQMYVNAINDRGKAEWEGATLMTEITEVEDEEE